MDLFATVAIRVYARLQPVRQLDWALTVLEDHHAKELTVQVHERGGILADGEAERKQAKRLARQHRAEISNGSIFLVTHVGLRRELEYDDRMTGAVWVFVARVAKLVGVGKECDYFEGACGLVRRDGRNRPREQAQRAQLMRGEAGH